MDDGAAAGDPTEGGSERVDRKREGRRARQSRQSVDVLAQALKERVYATFTGLAIVLVLRPHEPSPQDATFPLVIGVLGITVAGFVAEIIAHLGGARPFPEPCRAGADVPYRQRRVRVGIRADRAAAPHMAGVDRARDGAAGVDDRLPRHARAHRLRRGATHVARVVGARTARAPPSSASVLLGAIVVGLQLLAHS